MKINRLIDLISAIALRAIKFLEFVLPKGRIQLQGSFKISNKMVLTKVEINSRGRRRRLDYELDQLLPNLFKIESEFIKALFSLAYHEVSDIKGIIKFDRYIKFNTYQDVYVYFLDKWIDYAEYVDKNKDFKISRVDPYYFKNTYHPVEQDII